MLPLGFYELYFGALLLEPRLKLAFVIHLEDPEFLYTEVMVVQLIVFATTIGIWASLHADIIGYIWGV